MYTTLNYKLILHFLIITSLSRISIKCGKERITLFSQRHLSSADHAECMFKWLCGLFEAFEAKHDIINFNTHYLLTQSSLRVSIQRKASPWTSLKSELRKHCHDKLRILCWIRSLFGTDLKTGITVNGPEHQQFLHNHGRLQKERKKTKHMDMVDT